jgi:hypothetical protein
LLLYKQNKDIAAIESNYIAADGSIPLMGGVLALGDPNMNGSWQITWTADSLKIDRKESGNWVNHLEIP